MNAKNIIIQHPKKGQVKLGNLSHNELCRIVLFLMQDNHEAQSALHDVYLEYANYKASIDALSKEELKEL